MYGSYTGPVNRAACAAAVLGALTALLSSCTVPGMSRGGGSPVSDRSEMGAPFWVNPDSSAARQVSEWKKNGREQDAWELEKIAEQPVAEWIGAEDPEGQARGYTEAAVSVKRTALLVLYNIPHRDCGQYSQGGAADGDTYRRWIDRVVAGIGDRRAMVVLEPDALPHVVDGCTPFAYHEERYALLTYAVERLKALPGTRVYLDAGNAGWVRDPLRMTGPLQRAGLDRADGFSLNISNFYSTDVNTTYGKELSLLLGGKHFVIDTSRNGRGPLSGGHDEAWCNPPGRGLGIPPTTKTADPGIDAYLWIKRPGDSDGPCKGGPRAGTWWPEYALGLARNAAAP
jgi:endoglucanase